MKIRLEAKGFKANRELMDDIKNHNDENITKSLNELAEKIIDEAKSNLQNNTNIDSGTLLASIKILDETPGKSITVGTDEPYAGFIEYGRGPVNAKEGKWLHWIDKSTGKDVFAKHADPTEPSPFLEPAVLLYSQKYSDVYVNITEEMMKRSKSLLGNE